MVTPFPHLPAPPAWAIGLASGSPRRKELLARLYGPNDFRILAANVDESLLDDEDPVTYVTRLALAKAEAAATRATADTFDPSARRALIIGADTTVAANAAIFGKPTSPMMARAMLRQLSGRAHAVVTGLAVVEVQFDAAGAATIVRRETGHVTSTVLFRLLNDAEIEWYIGTGEPFDKAGAYGIQGYGALLINSIEGDYYNIVGLPLVELLRLLRLWG